LNKYQFEILNKALISISSIRLTKLLFASIDNEFCQLCQFFTDSTEMDYPLHNFIEIMLFIMTSVESVVIQDDNQARESVRHGPITNHLYFHVFHMKQSLLRCLYDIKDDYTNDDSIFIWFHQQFSEFTETISVFVKQLCSTEKIVQNLTNFERFNSQIIFLNVVTMLLEWNQLKKNRQIHQYESDIVTICDLLYDSFGIRHHRTGSDFDSLCWMLCDLIVAIVSNMKTIYQIVNSDLSNQEPYYSNWSSSIRSIRCAYYSLGCHCRYNDQVSSRMKNNMNVSVTILILLVAVLSQVVLRPMQCICRQHHHTMTMNAAVIMINR
jgi:hypothetical protein